MKKILSLLMLALVSIGTARAADVTLFTTDFSSSDWSAYTSESPITAKTTVNGIYFNCADYIANSALHFNGGGNISSGRFCAIHVTGVNQSVKIVIENNKSARVKYAIKEETEISNPGSSNVDPGASNTTTINYNMTGEGNELTFYFYQQGSGSPNIVKSITITTPDASTVTTVSLTEVTVNGDAISNLNELLSAGSLTISAPYVGVPVVKYNVQTSVKEGEADPVVSNKVETATLTEAEGTYTTTLVAGTNEYALSFTNVTVVNLLDVTDKADEILVLTKDNFVSFGYMSTTSENWNAGKTYGDYSGDFYNMSAAERKITVKVKGATSFEVFVSNTNSGRGYSIQVGEGTAQTIAHGGSGMEGSGIIECSAEETTITIAGTGNSVYPVYIVFNPAPEATEATITVPETITDDEFYYTTFSSDKALDFSGVKGIEAYTGVKTGNGAYLTLTQVEQIPANTGVVIKAAEAKDYIIPFAEGDVEAPEANDLIAAVETVSSSTVTNSYLIGNYMSSIFGDYLYFRSTDGYGDIPAGSAYLSLTDDESEIAYGTVYVQFPTAQGEVVTAANIGELKAMTEAATVELTLTNAQVTFSKYDSESGVDAFVLSDASGAVQINGVLGVSEYLPAGMILTGKTTIQLQVADYTAWGLGVVKEFTLTEDAATDLALAIYGSEANVTITEGTATPTVVTEDNIVDFLYDYDWRYVTLEGVTFGVTAGEYGLDDYSITSDLLDVIPISDKFNIASQFPADGTTINITGFMADLQGQVVFVPTEIAESASTLTVTVGADGYATFCSDQALEFPETSSIKAYTATLNGTDITFTRIYNVPANTGVLLWAEDGASEEIPVVDGGGVTGIQNVLKGTTVDMAAGSLTGKYILAKNGENIGFYKAGASATLAAGKAYIEVPAAARIILPGGETTGINGVEAAEADAAVYNLQGQRIQKAQKGLNIKNGRKYIVR